MLPMRSPAGEFRIVVVDYQRLHRGAGQRLLHHLGIFAIDDQDLGLGMIEREAEDRGIEPRVERIEDSAGHRHAVVRLDHRWRIGEHDRDGVAVFDAAARQRRRQLLRTRVEIPVVARQSAVDDRRRVGIHLGGARQKGQRRQRLEIGRIAVEVGIVWRRHGSAPLPGASLAKIANGE
jgi:hypothetical protein